MSEWPKMPPDSVWFYVSYPWWVRALRSLAVRFGNLVCRFERRTARFTKP